MEDTEADNDATPPLMEGEMSELAEIADANLDDSDVQSLDEHGDLGEIQDEPMRGEETESARELVDAVIDHAGASTMTMDEDSEAAASTTMDDETEPIEVARVVDPDEERKQAAMEEESNGGMVPLLEDDGGASDARETPPDATDVAIYGLADVKEEPTDEESSQPPGSSEGSGETTGAGQFASSNLPSTFPHCHVCGFDRETVFTREKKAPSGPHKNKIIYRNRCVRKACIRSFGPSYIWDAKVGEYVKIAEETSAASRPYALAPKEKKYPEIDYQRAGPSGVMPPVDNNGAWAKASRTAAAVSTPPGGSIFDSAESQPSTSSAHDSPSSSTRATTSSSSSTPAVKPPPRQRKGYAWVEEEVLPPRPDPVMELAKMYEAQQRAEEEQLRDVKSMRTIGSQTGDEDHVVELLVDEMKKTAMFPALRPTDEVPITNANIQSLSNRLYLTQRTLKLQYNEIKQLRAERDVLARNQKTIIAMLQDYRKCLVADITRLKEDVVMANKDLRNFSLEMQNEAQKDIKDIRKIQHQVASRLDESDRYRMKVEAALKFEKTKTEEAQFLADKYHRKMVELERKILIAKMEEEDAKEKLNDKIYLTNNAKCTHCQVNERIKNMLTEQIADKTLLTTNLGKERAELARRLENSEKIAAIVSKENKQLKFEKLAWEGTCHKLKAELMQLRGNTTGLVTKDETLVFPSSGEAAFTPQSVNKDADDVSPDGERDEIMDTLERPPASSSASSAEEGELRDDSPNTLARLPPPPPPPQPSQLRAPSPDHAAAFANWVPKDRKVQEPPPEYAEVLRKVNESLERGPQPKEKMTGPPSKKEKKDEKGAKRGGPPFSANSHHKNGEKKPKLEGAVKKEEKGQPSPRPIPTLGGPKKPPPPPPPPPRREIKEERREEKERRREPSPMPFSSTHEPAFPAVVAKKSVKVPYNGPSSLTTGNNGGHGGHSSVASTSKGSPALPKKQPVEEKKKPMSFLPVAGSLAIPSVSSRDQSSLPNLDANALLREAERLRAIERQRQRHDQPRDSYVFDPVAAAADRDRRASMQPMMGGQGGAPPRAAPSRAVDFTDFTDDDLPWNAARGPGFNQQQQQQHMGGRPRTPTQDWYEPRGGAGGLAPPQMQQQPRAPSPGQRYFDDMYNPRLPRDQFGRIEPEFAPRFHHPGITSAPPPMRASPPLFQHPPPNHALLRGAPPPAFQGPPPGLHNQGLGLPPHLQQAPPPGPHDPWRRPDPNWNNGEPPRRNYWDS